MSTETDPLPRPASRNRRLGVLCGVVWAVLATGLAGAAQGTWAPDEGRYRLGVMPFSTLSKGGEWSLGVGRDLTSGASRSTWSYLGAGLSVARPFGALGDVSDRDPLDGVKLGPWVGGCLSCNLGGGATLDLEVRWAPSSLSVGGDPLAGEERGGLMLKIPW